MNIPELVPLEGGEPHRSKRPTRSSLRAPVRQISHSSRGCVKGPLKALRIVLLITVVPAMFIFIPVYLRYRVFSSQIYPVGMTDMRMIDNKISTTWCQRQIIRSNATFNAYLLSEQPRILSDLVPVTMTRTLTLQDDMKEYWGFYLLEGSVVTVSTCCRWPGASLIMIRGHKHLQQCAYIGDDSSEELEELLEANQLGKITNATLLERIKILLKDDSPANDPDAMKRHKGGVRFHDPSHDSRPPNTMVHHEPPAPLEAPDVTDHEPQELRQLLEMLHAQRRAYKELEEEKERNTTYRPPAHLMALPGLHRHRDTNVDRQERKWLSFTDLDGNTTFQDNGQDNEPNKTIGEDNEKTMEVQETVIDENIDLGKKLNSIESNKLGDLNKIGESNKDEKFKTVEKSEKTVKSNELGETNKLDDTNKFNESVKAAESEAQTSSELYEDIVDQLKSLGDKGKRVLSRLSHNANKSTTTPASVPIDLDEQKLNHLTDVLTEAINEEDNKEKLRKKRHEANEAARIKRQIYIQQAEFAKSLNEDDEERNSAIEEGLEKDGFAEVHRIVNETTANDMSNSEFWSSFSSSEEALLECAGLILNLPLAPHPGCTRDSSEEQHTRAANMNTVTYRVPANGYYFFVFSSENEVQDNFIRAKFDLQKTLYDVRRTILECRNFTDRCDIPLDFLSSEKVVLEVPLRNNDSLWNEEFVVISECVPRTSIYLACAVAVPLLIVLFAFQ